MTLAPAQTQNNSIGRPCRSASGMWSMPWVSTRPAFSAAVGAGSGAESGRIGSMSVTDGLQVGRCGENGGWLLVEWPIAYWSLIQ